LATIAGAAVGSGGRDLTAAEVAPPPPVTAPALLEAEVLMLASAILV